MIDEKVFKDGWALICERFGREPSHPLMMAYYQSLSPKMSTEQFQNAARRVFEQNEFFPKPADFLEVTKPDTAAEAVDQWEHVNDVMRGFLPAASPKLTEESRRIIRMLGGESELHRTNVDHVHHVRRQFMQFYGGSEATEFRETQQRLTPGAEASKIAAAVTVKEL